MKGSELIARYSQGERSFVGAHLAGANLAGANLAGANLGGVYLRGAALTGANLRGAALRFANLRGADLTGADLTGADLTGADLTGADLTGANLGGVVIGWSSHDLLSEILWRAADTEPRRMLAAYVGRMREWCWAEWSEWQHPERDWALTELAKWVKDGDDAPGIVLEARGEVSP